MKKSSTVERARSIYSERGATTLLQRLLSESVRILIEKYRQIKYQAFSEFLLPTLVKADVSGSSALYIVETQPEYRRFIELDLGNERPVISDLLNRIEHEDVFWDIGANTGMYTCLLANKIPGENLIAFEPFPTNVHQLKKNLVLNSSTVQIQEIGLSDYVGNAKLEVVSRGVAGAGTYTLNPTESEDWVEVRVETGDNLVATGAVPPPDVLKIDVEGLEINVLRGLRETISQAHCRLVYCEVHGQPNEDLSIESRKTLRECGFSVEVYENGQWGHHLRAVKDNFSSG
jgi:FkbM family methyltransferase